MKRLSQLLFSVFLLVPLLCAAAPVSVHNLRLWQAPDNTRLVFDLSGPLEHRLSTLSNPDRIVIELSNARLQDGLAALDVSHSYISAVRATELAGGVLRITLELNRPVRPKTFLLRPAGQYGHRLVIDLFDETAVEAVPEPEPISAPPARTTLRPADLVVAIDAGHGGEDPGAIGRRWRTREKDVTLAIARELYSMINSVAGMKAVMIRDGDYFVELGQRRKKAKRFKADVFVSIHADSLPGKRAQQARGSSVYALSERGATNEIAKALAASENASDWIGGISTRDVDSDVLKVIGDLNKDATIIDSLKLGTGIIGSLRGAVPIHGERPAQAAFAVLKQPIPSILVETAFISNQQDEQNLRDRAYQKRIAEGILRGLRQAAPWILARRDAGGETVQAAGRPPASAAPAPLPAAASAAQEHMVKVGETLSSIARHYDINVDALRFLNDIHGNDLPVGTRLRIPMRGGDG
jgi:N-acetylmuramoyl-L-alanine amidase